ncbi:hypothetical protein CEUSTIGMA_g5067.t1 [Chlamydomonas eustigma]|uniref:4-hydroxy-tetrahydrodipicolinate reductase n=1 Tax=Chlamydomonas eustigma TaxID=1157962 RepID=A0A250X3H0_9CHLO|nr:hypothetical protein CEUSTIGMA_g5067.t1 [Chlamydomonas eustigma]|eukprot:GAX77624.1 hypothetical protein CEUSTIGMA_g5067.t1 [Chlamydomonas eustigma]
MGQAVGEAAVRAGLELIPYSFCSSKDSKTKSQIDVGGISVELVGPGQDRDNLIKTLQSQYPNMITVDYTVPDVIHDMVDMYIKHGMPFVMGTTGGDRNRISKEVIESGVYAVIAPNMGKQIVAFQATMETMASNFPGAFSGYTLKVMESHQSSKKDTSGTAKAVVQSFQGLGLNFDVSQIQLIRQPPEQVNVMKVPESALLGHAFHTYQLLSPDGTVTFEFQHNVVGRSTYAEGTVDACLFLAQQVQERAPKTLYNMVDVLRAGAMR